MMETGVIEIAGTFAIYLPGKAMPGTVGSLLQNAWNRFNATQSQCRAGEFATIVLMIARQEMQLQAFLLNSDHVLRRQSQHHYRVEINTFGLGGVRYTRGPLPAAVTLEGSLADLLKYADPLAKVRTHIGKIIRFTYNGGTKPGIRVIRLENVGADSLKGVDVTKSEDESEAFRHYKVDKIVGVIDVLN